MRAECGQVGQTHESSSTLWRVWSWSNVMYAILIGVFSISSPDKAVMKGLQYVDHIPLNIGHETVESLLPVLWRQSGVLTQVPHDIEIRTHFVGQTCQSEEILISTIVTDCMTIYLYQKCLISADL